MIYHWYIEISWWYITISRWLDILIYHWYITDISMIYDTKNIWKYWYIYQFKNLQWYISDISWFLSDISWYFVIYRDISRDISKYEGDVFGWYTGIICHHMDSYKISHDISLIYHWYITDISLIFKIIKIIKHWTDISPIYHEKILIYH